MDLILLPHAREAGGGGAGSEAAGQRSGPRASPELDFCETRVARQKQKTPPAPARPGWDVLFLRDERGGRLRPPVGPLASSSGTVRRTAGWEGTVARVELLPGGWNLQENPHHWTLGAWAPEEGWGLSGRGEAEVQPGSHCLWGPHLPPHETVLGAEEERTDLRSGCENLGPANELPPWEAPALWPRVSRSLSGNEFPEVWSSEERARGLWG